jgi:putative spermidine/putrescine transport system permease protein
MSNVARIDTRDAPVARPAARKFSWAWLGVVPFFLFATAFLLLPAASIVVTSFRDRQGAFTFANIVGLFQPFILRTYWTSIQVSAVTALGGGVFGFLLAYAVILGGLPPIFRSTLMTFSGVASNFAGVPLAFAFVATLGRLGLATVILKNYLGLDLYGAGFNLYTYWGIILTYMYFQLPLMVLIIAPALDGLKREWREASQNLGATNGQYWRYIALPVLLPSLLGTIILLFGNAFGAYATAYALTGGQIGLVTIVIGQQISGDVLHNPGLGSALALGMVVVMAVSLGAYALLQRRAARWVRR